MSLKEEFGDKRWHGRPGKDLYAVYRSQLLAWALGQGRRYKQVLTAEGSFGKLKYVAAGVGPSSDEDDDVDSMHIAAAGKGDNKTVKVEPETTDTQASPLKSSLATSSNRSRAKRQREYNRISEKLYSRILATLGPGPTKQILNKSIEAGNARLAFCALEGAYGHADPLDLPSLFDDLVTISMSGEKFEDYVFKFSQNVSAIDMNPEMAEWKIRGKDHVLPDVLLNAMFLRGLGQGFNAFVVSRRMDKVKHTFDQTVVDATSFNTTQLRDTKDQIDGELGANAADGNVFQSARADRDKKKTCFNFRRLGTCRFGTKCRYSHDRQADEGRDKHANLVSTITKSVLKKIWRDKPGDYADPSLLAGSPSPARPQRLSYPDGEDKSSRGTPVSYYAVYKGKKGYTGIVTSWGEAREKVKHRDGSVRTGVNWRKFSAKDDAEEYLYAKAADDSSTASSCLLLTSSAGGTEVRCHQMNFAGMSARILDTGTNVHLQESSEGLENVTRCFETVRVASGDIRKLKGKGDRGILKGVRILPGGSNLVSIGKICDTTAQGILFLSGSVFQGHFSVPSGARRIGYRDSSTNGLYLAHATAFAVESSASPGPSVPSQTISGGRGRGAARIPSQLQHNSAPGHSKSTGTIPTPKQIGLARLLHDRLGHISYKKIAEAVSAGLVDSKVPVKVLEYLSSNPPPCLGCGLGKSVRRRFSPVQETKARADCPFRRLCVDTCIVSNPSRSRFNCFLLIVDEFSRHVWVLTLRKRADAPHRFRLFIRDLRRAGLRDKIDIIRCDGARELTFGFADLRREEGIQSEYGAPYSSTQTNPFVERAIRTVVQMSRCSMCHAKVPTKLWKECLEYNVYLYNRLPHSGLPGGSSPLLALRGSSHPHSRLRHIHTFYAPVFSRIPTNPRGNKFGAMAKFGRFVGLDPVNKGYRVYANGTVFVRRDVYFHDDITRSRDLFIQDRVPNADFEGVSPLPGGPMSGVDRIEARPQGEGRC